MAGTCDPWGYFGHLNNLRTELEALLRRRVDVVDRRGLRRNREVILAGSIPL
jgi:predicted nucleotidyltransferase